MKSHKDTQDFPVENPYFPVENSWKECGILAHLCGKETGRYKGCGKVQMFSTDFPQR
jgi:hypothetical protein